MDGRGKGRSSGIVVWATARFVEAYRLGQDSKTWALGRQPTSRRKNAERGVSRVRRHGGHHW